MGTFLAIAAAWLAKEPSPKSTVPAIASVTLLAAQTDFSEPGELGVFIDPDQLKSLREEMMRTGYLSGQQMADAFRFLNARDLIWSRMTQRYLLGKDEIGNDMMSWNADHTRLPERMHNEYLTQLFLNNALAEGHFRMNNAPVALINIEAPMMVIGTERDHVSPCVRCTKFTCIPIPTLPLYWLQADTMRASCQSQGIHIGTFSWGTHPKILDGPPQTIGPNRRSEPRFLVARVV